MLQPAVRTHTGLRRSHNEDSVFGTPRLVAVADGVGGSVAGEVASGAVVAALAQLEKCWLSEPLPFALEAAIREGNERIAFVAECRPELAGMGTTLTAVAIEDSFVVANVGNSRTYLYRRGVLEQLTRDDSLIQELLDAGAVDTAAARWHPQRSVVLQALDGDPARHAAIRTCPARLGDRLLLCSDGLSDLVEHDALVDALRIRSREDSADRLLALALEAGGRDNVSIVVADVVPAESPLARWRRPANALGR